jgi:hypothetical protein
VEAFGLGAGRALASYIWADFTERKADTGGEFAALRPRPAGSAPTEARMATTPGDQGSC